MGQGLPCDSWGCTGYLVPAENPATFYYSVPVPSVKKLDNETREFYFLVISLTAQKSFYAN